MARLTELVAESTSTEVEIEVELTEEEIGLQEAVTDLEDSVMDLLMDLTENISDGSLTDEQLIALTEAFEVIDLDEAEEELSEVKRRTKKAKKCNSPVCRKRNAKNRMKYKRNKRQMKKKRDLYLKRNKAYFAKKAA